MWGWYLGMTLWYAFVFGATEVLGLALGVHVWARVGPHTNFRLLWVCVPNGLEFLKYFKPYKPQTLNPKPLNPKPLNP